LTESLGLNVDEGKSRASNELSSRSVTDVVNEGLTVRGNKDGDGAVEIAGNNTFIDGEGDRGTLSTNEHLAVQVLLISSTLNGSRAEGQLGARADGSSVRDLEDFVGGDAKVARTIEEGTSEGQDFGRSESEIEGVGDGGSGSGQQVQDRLMPGLNSEDRSSGRHEDGISEEGSTT
jgi:hypothetical protein